MKRKRINKLEWSGVQKFYFWSVGIRKLNLQTPFLNLNLQFCKELMVCKISPSKSRAHSKYQNTDKNSEALLSDGRLHSNR